MSLLTTSAVRARALQEDRGFHITAGLLEERMKKQASFVQHDIFLSHAFDDKELVLGVCLTLEDLGYSVYLDWRDDPTLDRKRVSPTTAAKLTSKTIYYPFLSVSRASALSRLARQVSV